MMSAQALPFNPTTKLLLWVLATTGVAARTLQWHATFSIYHLMEMTTVEGVAVVAEVGDL
jgi:hypothetical protein